MIPKLSRYLDRIYAIVHSRADIEVERFEFIDRSDAPAQTSRLFMRLRFYDGSLLIVEEALKVVGGSAFAKTRYRYHYQRDDGTLVFRYDNAPHHPGLRNFPHHKHVGERVEPTQPPDLNDVLREIETLIYGKSNVHDTAP